MKKTPAAKGDSGPEEIAALAARLRETVQRLQELTGGEVDAVLTAGGQSYLLQEAQERLQQSEEKFRNMYNAAAAGIAVSTPDGRFLQANAAYCQMLGYTEDELRELTFAALTHPDDLILNLELRDELLAGQRQSFVMEKRYLKKNGDIVWTRHSVSATHGPGGEIATLMVIAEDITERKRAQEELQRKQTELEVLFDLVPAMLCFKDTENGFLRVNQRMAVAAGRPIAEMEGKSAAEIFPPEAAAKYYADDQEVIRSGAPKLGIIEKMMGAGGKDLWVQTDKVPVRDQDRKVTGIVVMIQDITERKEAEEALALFRTLVDGSPDAIEVIDPATGRFLDVNTTGCARLGYSREEMLSLHLADIDIEKDYRSLWPGIVEEIKKTGSATIIGRHRRKDGSTFPVEVSSRYINLNRGYLVAVVRDITERQLAEAALRQSEERLRLITDLVPMGIFAKDASGRHLFANPALAEMAGMSVEEIIGKDDFDLVASRTEAEAYRADDLAVIQSGQKKHIAEEPRTDLSGRTRILETIKIPFTVAESGEPAVLGVCIDITERKRMEGRFRLLIDSNAQSVFFWNTRGEIHDGNDAFLRLVGYTREDLQAGRIRWTEMTPPEYVESDRRALDEIAAKSLCTAYEKEFIRKDGSRVPILIGAAVFKDNPEEGVAFVVDLTERKKLEQQFFRAQRMESIGTLAGGIAHDLNNILAPIMMSIHLLKDFATEPEEKNILETIELSAQRGAEIVRQVLSFARGVESERIEVHPKHLLKDVENIIKDTFPKDIRMKFTVPANAWMVFGDPTQIHQILLNLCVNARDAMPNGGNLTVSVKNCVLDEQYAAMHLESKPGRYVLISVADSGVGMPRAIIDKIFEPFFTTKEINKGTGLGLSTVMAIVKSHEGVINVYSEPGRGTTFNVYLPAVRDSARTDSESAGKPGLVRGNGETVLIVDDEASIINITSKTLQAFGYKVLSAFDGPEGVAVYAGKMDEIAVVLTDMTMPVMDGPAMIYALRRINPAVKIIAASGLHANGSASRLDIPGVKHFISKPYTAETLLKVLRKILDEE